MHTGHNLTLRLPELSKKSSLKLPVSHKRMFNQNRGYWNSTSDSIIISVEIFFLFSTHYSQSNTSSSSFELHIPPQEQTHLSHTLPQFQQVDWITYKHTYIVHNSYNFIAMLDPTGPLLHAGNFPMKTESFAFKDIELIQVKLGATKENTQFKQHNVCFRIFPLMVISVRNTIEHLKISDDIKIQASMSFDERLSDGEPLLNKECSMGNEQQHDSQCCFQGSDQCKIITNCYLTLNSTITYFFSK